MVSWASCFRSWDFFKNNDSVIVTQRAFRRHFNINRNDSVPSRNTILLWIKNIRETACAVKKRPPGKVRTVRTPENIARVRDAVISHRGEVRWSPRSPDLSVCDYFLWGYLKSRVYQDRPRTTADLNNNIRREIAAISAEVLQRVMRDLPLRLQECADNAGQHLKPTIFKKWFMYVMLSKCFELIFNSEIK